VDEICRLALQNIYLLENSTSYRRYAIFTDSLSSVQNFSTNASRNRPNLYIKATKLIQKLQSYITLIWIPSHIGIPGNKRADCLANIGIKLQHVNIDIRLETSEAQKLATDYVYKLWQQY